MTTPSDTNDRSPLMRFLRRTVGAALLGIVFFIALWMAVFDAVNSALISSGTAVVLVAGSSVSETFQTIFEAITEVILGIFGAIADFFSSLFN
ncbi:hypothetical protein [Hyphomicrobium sp. CS1GBMeth3]|uniref:hypothetical protein n=1 Tax=Hyphomicrobium sp. CS1GBMeth3 TaxID=1892845 RepID=UPI00093008D6|nr:hypothetical protein [Hyphomicrobium sp. CS1GBMeth3]